MAVIKKNLELYTGETFRHTFIYRDSADNIVSLTGATAKMEVRSLFDSTKIYLVLSSANGRIAFDTTLGHVIVTIPDEVNIPANIKWEEGNYDLRVTFSNGEVDTLAYGKMVVRPGVTLLP